MVGFASRALASNPLSEIGVSTRFDSFPDETVGPFLI